MKSVAYLRVSTQEQSSQRQSEELELFAKHKGLMLVKTFEDIISGSKVSIDDRDDFNKMERYLNENLDVKNIVILELSRLGRRNLDILTFVEKCTTKGINIHIKDLNLSTLDSKGEKSLMSGMMIALLGSMAENESRLLSSRIKSGKLSRAKQNLAFGGKITGYKKAKDGTPKIDENEAPIIRRIFELASQSIGSRSISDIIDEEFDRNFAVGTIGGIIRNSFYKGERKYKELVLKVEPIVSEEVWKLANDYIDGRKKFTSRAYAYVNLVQGKIKCHVCESTMHQYVIKSARADQFRCKNKECKNIVNRPWLYDEIRKVVEKYAKKSKDKKVREQFNLKITSYKARIISNKKELEKLNRRRVKARIQYIDDNDFLIEDYNVIQEEIKNSVKNIDKDTIRLNEELRACEIALKSDIEHFSKDLELFKTEINEILKSVEVWKEFVSINLFGWREHIIMKPKSGELGWKTRREKKGLYEVNEVNNYDNSYNDDEIEVMINHIIKENEEHIIGKNSI